MEIADTPKICTTDVSSYLPPKFFSTPSAASKSEAKYFYLHIKCGNCQIFA